MKPVLQLVIILFICIPSLYAQSPINILKHINNPGFQKNKIIKTPANILAENCSNGIDDDGNGLIDMKDFSCYFSNTSPDTCIPTKVIWATFRFWLYWFDLETNTDRKMSFPSSESYGDITWAPNGKLYGADEYTGTIREIDPYTGQTQFVDSVPGYYYTNGMTADAQNNLYLSSRTRTNQWNVLKLNLTTGNITNVADLTAKGLEAAGDLTFLNGFLYVSCLNSKLAKIDIFNGNLQIINYTGTGPTGAYGLITLGDGYLYMSSNDELHQLDTTTWVSIFYYRYPTYGFVFGLSTYNEFCNSPVCRAKATISVQNSAPYCSNTGVKLKGTGIGITGASGYTWTLPNGQTKNGDTLTAFVSGKYYMRYYILPDSCGATDSINLNIIQYPGINLGNDTALCPNATLALQPVSTTGITSYLWQDGAIGTQYIVTQPGLFWVEGRNVCGVKRDSVTISLDTLQKIDLGAGTQLCPGASMGIKNNFAKRPSASYIWSTGSVADSITINKAGTYWLEVKNSCGTVRDSIIVSMKDTCTCKPFFALVNLGANKELCQYDTLIVKNSIDQIGYRYLWQDGSTSNSLIVRQPGIYWADVSTYCNTIRDSIIVTEKTADCDCLVYLANAFTPNGDGKNDIFKPRSNCDFKGEIKIYNRWGNLVYTSTNLQVGWNGYYKDVNQPNDVYVYYISYKFLTRPGNFNKRGTFILLR